MFRATVSPIIRSTLTVCTVLRTKAYILTKTFYDQGPQVKVLLPYFSIDNTRVIYTKKGLNS